MHRIHVLINKNVPVAPHQLPRPCDFFDIIGGNGTGGLIALMLGRMRMDVETCKEYYEALTRYVFYTDKTILGLPYGKTLFKASRLEEAIKVCVRECKHKPTATVCLSEATNNAIIQVPDLITFLFCIIFHLIDESQ